jgi:hypothetical protein
MKSTGIETGTQTRIQFFLRRRGDRIPQISFDRSRILRQSCLAEFKLNALGACGRRLYIETGDWFSFMLWVTEGVFDAPLFLVLAALAA